MVPSGDPFSVYPGKDGPVASLRALNFKDALQDVDILRALAQRTSHEHYLSGTGIDNTKTWDFFCSAGQNSGKWKKIEVPFNWELQGFGEYTYG